MLISDQYAIKQKLAKVILSGIQPCHQVRTLGADCVPQHESVNLYHVVGVIHGFIGGALTQLRVVEHVHHIFMSLTHLTR